MAVTPTAQLVRRLDRFRALAMPATLCRMGTIDLERLRALERQLGMTLPKDFVAVLRDRDPVTRDDEFVLHVSGDPMTVDQTFSLDSGNQDQLDAVFALVSDVLPAGAVPFAEDIAGNFYCLMLSGPTLGQVVWWDHERDLGDDSVVPVAESITQFFDGLLPRFEK